MFRVRFPAAVGLASVLALVGVAACGQEAAPQLAASSAWSRPTPSGATNGVAYLTLTTDVDDSLVSAEVPASIARAVELHRTTIGGSAGGHVHGGAGGETVSMGSVERFDLLPGEPLEFAPGGNHLMLIDLPAALERGSSFELSLHFSSGRTLDVDVTVADNPPS